jgi:O-antigen/teichoic acid export membrane protein
VSTIKKLAGQTAIYGVSSIVGRLINFLLYPIYTRVFAPDEFAVVTQLYAYIAFFNILFTYGLETAFFRYFQTRNGDAKVYSTSLISILISSLSLGLLIFLFSSPLSVIISGTDVNKSVYIKFFAAILAMEAITAIPFAKLRQQNKAKRFALIRMIGIGVNVALNVFFLILCPVVAKSSGGEWILKIYDPSFGVGYVFFCNFISSLVTLICLLPEILGIKFKFDSALWKEMLIYAFPIMITGFAGIINETFDRILLPVLLTDKSTAMTQLGIYGACYKLSILMTLFIQAFRYAAEPFFFNHSTKENPQKVYAQVMNGFVIVCSFIFLGIMLYIDIVKYFIGVEFRSGLKVVPVLLMANLCLGVYYNLSIWYKLTGKTQWGAWLSIAGAFITLLFNIWLIPVLGYMGAAWATLICYASMMIMSFFIGQRYYPVPYQIPAFVFYVSLSLVLWMLSNMLTGYLSGHDKLILALNSVFLICFGLIAYYFERRKNGYLHRAES